MLFYPAYSQVTFSGGNISGNNVSKNLDNNSNNYIITDSKAVDGMCDTNRISKVSSHLEYSNDFSLKDHIIVETKIPQYRSFSFAETNPLIGGEVSPEIKAVGDLNNDGIDDLIIDYYETSLPPIILLGSKNGKFVELKYNTKNASRRHIRNAELADLNNDGWLDFIGFTTGDSSKIWEKSGYSTFGNSIPRGQEDLVLMNNQGKNFYELIVPEVRKNDWNHGGTTADLNNDGWLDILPLSEGEKEFTVPLENLNGKEFILGEYEYSKDISYYLTTDIDAGDINNDGYQDFVVAITNIRPRTPSDNNFIGTLRVIFGDGDFDFRNNLEYKFGTIWLTDQKGKKIVNQFKGKMKPGAGHEPSKIVTGNSNVELIDVDGDGYLDILEGQFHTVSGLWSGSGFKFYRFNGDCFEDATDKFFPNQFTNRNIKDNYFTAFIQNFKMEDINNDGLKDLIIQTDSGSDQHWYKNPDNIGFPYIFINKNNKKFLPVNFKDKYFSPLINLNHLVPGDFNGDGKADLIGITGSHKPKLRVLLNSSSLSEKIQPINLSNKKLKCNFEIRRYLNQQDDLLSIGKFRMENGNIRFYQNEWKSGINRYQENLLINQAKLKVSSEGELKGYLPIYRGFGSGLIELLFLDESKNVINLHETSLKKAIWEIDNRTKIALVVSNCENSNQNNAIVSKILELEPEIKIPNKIFKQNLKCNFNIERNLIKNSNLSIISEGEIKIKDGKIDFLREEWKTGKSGEQLDILNKYSHLYVAESGNLVGSIKIYIAFDNDEIKKLHFSNKLQNINQNFKVEGKNIGIIDENIQISLEISKCEFLDNENHQHNYEISNSKIINNLYTNNLKCNFEIERFLFVENDIKKIAEGSINIIDGKVDFIFEKWRTGPNISNNKILTKFSNLFVFKNGGLFGESSIYFLFGSDEKRKLKLENIFKSYNHSFEPEGENIVKLNNKDKISYKISNCNNIENQSNNKVLESKIENKQISSVLNLTCNFSLVRNLMNENEINEIARGKFKIHDGKIIFTNQEWNTGGNTNNKNILDVSNLNIDNNGFLIGSLPIYTMFGNDEVRVLDVKKKVIRDQKWISGTHDLGIIENHIKIFLKPENCKK